MNDQLLFKTSTMKDGNMSFRYGGEAEVLKNREKFLSQHQIPFSDHVPMRCDHGDQIAVVSSGHTAVGAHTHAAMVRAEVLVTHEKNVALMLLTADCLPIAFYDPQHGVIALAHLSRVTTCNELVKKVIDFLAAQYATSPHLLTVAIGPHVHQNSYRFALPLHEVHQTLRPFITETDGFAFVDLTAANQAQLHAAGVPTDNITVSDIDTVTSPDHFSHYRSRHTGEPEGRIATILMQQEE